ncbi:hypothetical protein [Polymorphospora sp. NPDC050346]|uniref:hypothetical protein n=1 Tax=Polymorphospora sp. NPDC050346 TaxID=3155780 RepID=UPI0033E55DEC
MSEPVTATEVGRGEYADYEVLAVFGNETEAQRFVDDWNLKHINDIQRGRTAPAEIRGTVPYYPAGTWRH